MAERSITGKFCPNLPRWRSGAGRGDDDPDTRQTDPPDWKRHLEVRSAIAGTQTNDAQNSLEIVIAVVLDFDPTAFRSMMNRDVGPQMLTQFVLQIGDRR